MTLRELNRALLARQGLLEPLDAPLAEAVESIGALQAQHWPALPVALASRVRAFDPEDLYGALERGELVAGTLLRATLHLVSAGEHPAYAAVVAAAGTDDWRRTDAEPGPEAERLRGDLLEYAREAPRTREDIAAFIEELVARHPGALDPKEIEHQRTYKWRAFLRWSAFVRVPENGHWGSKAPAALRAAPIAPDPPTADQALDEVVRRHLRAFGPAGGEDVASWIGWRIPPVRAALERLEPELARFEDDNGRVLYDIPDSPRPGPDAPAPPRLLAPFDSVLLAYAAGRRARILPDAHRDAVYERANLRIRPTFLIDGLVAGTWKIEARRHEAVVTLTALERLARSARDALVREAERVARAIQPAATTHSAVIGTMG